MNKKSYIFQKNVTATIIDNNLLMNGEGVVVGISGGADSVALLLVLSTISLNLKLTAVYVDHGLRPEETPDEISSIAKLCETLRIDFIVKIVDVKHLAQKEGRSIEDAARHLRYQALEEVRTEYNLSKIAVGHHGDDQLEEFFIRLVRGSGVSGLSGMLPRYKNIIRPLLFESKETIENYLQEQKTIWSTDSSNLSHHFLRNRIRLELIPELQKNYAPALRTTVLNTMDILHEEDSYIQSVSDKLFKLCVTREDFKENINDSPTLLLNLPSFLSNHLAIRRRILEKICWEMDSRPSYQTLLDLCLLTENTDNGKELHLQKGLVVIKTANHLQFTKPTISRRNSERVCEIQPYNIAIQRPGTYQIPGTSYFVTLTEIQTEAVRSTQQSGLLVDLGDIEFPLAIRGYKAGERFIPKNSVGSKKISRYYNEIKLDKLKRGNWPLLVCKDSVIAVIGHAINHKYRVTDKSKRLLRISLTEESNRID